MRNEDRTFLESIVFSYLIGEVGMNPIQAQKKIEAMTDQELEEFAE